MRDRTLLKGKLHRWFIRLSAFDFSIEHRKGTSHSLVDALSRAPTDDPQDLEPESVQLLDNSSSWSMVHGPHTENHPISNGNVFLPNEEVFIIQSNPITTELIKQHQQQQDFSSIRNITDHDGLKCVTIHGIRRVILPLDLRSMALEYFHNEYGHPGTNKVVQLLIEAKLWWPNFIKDTSLFIKACHTCQVVNSRNHPSFGLLRPLGPATMPLERVGFDTIDLGRSAIDTKAKYIQTFVDHHSRYLWAFATPSNTDDAIISCIKKVIDGSMVPKSVLSDQGRSFISKKLKRFLENNKIKHSFSSTFHPQTNGMVEKHNHTITTRLRKLMVDKPHLKWSTLLPTAVDQHNNTPHSVTGFAPAYLMANTLKDSQPVPQDQLNQAHALATERTTEFQKQKKLAYDKRRRDLVLEPGDLVLREVAHHHPSLKKLDPRFRGPYRIHSQVGSNTYRVQRFQDDSNPEIVHTSQLRRYIDVTPFLKQGENCDESQQSTVTKHALGPRSTVLVPEQVKTDSRSMVHGPQTRSRAAQPTMVHSPLNPISSPGASFPLISPRITRSMAGRHQLAP